MGRYVHRSGDEIAERGVALQVAETTEKRAANSEWGRVINKSLLQYCR